MKRKRRNIIILVCLFCLFNFIAFGINLLEFQRLEINALHELAQQNQWNRDYYTLYFWLNDNLDDAALVTTPAILEDSGIGEGGLHRFTYIDLQLTDQSIPLLFDRASTAAIMDFEGGMRYVLISGATNRYSLHVEEDSVFIVPQGDAS